MLKIFHTTIIYIRLVFALMLFTMVTMHLHQPNVHNIHQKCFEYILNSNIKHSDVVVWWSDSNSDFDFADYNLIEKIMDKTHVIILNENVLINRLNVKHFSNPNNVNNNNDTFSHQIKNGDIFSIVTDISSLYNTIESISKEIVYNSRGYFAIYLQQQQPQPKKQQYHQQQPDNIMLKWKSFPIDSRIDNHEWTHNVNDSRKWIENGHSNKVMERDDFFNKNNNNNIDKILRKAFRILWSRNIFNAIIMLCDDNKVNIKMRPTIVKCSIFTWFPYDEQCLCGNVIEHFVKIDECVFDGRLNHLMFHYAKENKLYYGESVCGINESLSDECNHLENKNHSQHRNSSSVISTKINKENENEVDGEPLLSITGIGYEDKVVNINTHVLPKFHLTQNEFNILMEMQKDNNNYEGQRNSINVDDNNKNNTNNNIDNNNTGNNNNCNEGNRKLSKAKHNLCYTNVINPMLLLHTIVTNNTAANINDPILSRNVRERDQNHKLASKFFEYDYRPFGTIEFHENNNFLIKKFSSMNHRKFMKININNYNKENRKPVQRTISNILRPHFYEKIPNNLNGCKYKAAVVVWPPFVTPSSARFYGLEHKLIRDVLRHMNIEMIEKYVQNENIRIQSESMKNLLVNMSCDFGFGNLYPTNNMHKTLDTSIGYLYDQVNWIVPLGKPLPAWTNLLNCFR